MVERLDAAALRRAMEIYLAALRRHRDELNSLNVYPVPDGDTGTNLLMTQEAVVAALPPEGDLEAIGEAVSRASLMGARGNSGVILSQILRGLMEAVPRDGALEGIELVIALERASSEAHRAVARPVEGTILTVIRDAARAATEAAERRTTTIGAILEAARDEARASLARTTDLLPELGRAGVVDAGAKGVVLLLDALLAALGGAMVSEPVGPMGPLGRVSETPDTGRLDFTFEVQYLLEAPDQAIPRLRQELSGLGDSLVVVGGNSLFNVHVHTNQPDRAVQVGDAVGRTNDLHITDLSEQVVSCMAGQARAVRVAEQVTGLVAVVQGEGLTETIASLGVLVVPGGPADHPTLAALVEAIDAVGAEAVIVLPNDPGIVPVARKAADESSAAVHVVDSPSIASGLAAATVFNPLASVDENVRAMEGAIRDSGWGEVRPAEKPMGSSGAAPGDWIGTVRGDVVSARGSAAEAAADVVRRLAETDAEVVTLIVGAGASPSDRVAVEEAVVRATPRLELQVLDGGQRGVPFVLGIE